MPSKTFDYKVVDFSTFQGGSANVTNQVNFEQTMVRKSIVHFVHLYSNINVLFRYFSRRGKKKKHEEGRSKN